MTGPDDTTRCAICGEPNGCGMAAGRDRCWCTDVTIRPDVLARIPEARRNRICICERCAGR